jgi:sugar phosphate isomerase/epimerase
MKRRALLKSIAALPMAKAVAMATAIAASPGLAAVAGSHGNRTKLSLNVYSFDRLLRDGSVDLFDILEFCAAQDFDAIDPTGYYFPGYPAVPPDEYINRFKRKAFLRGLDISGTGVRNDFVNPDPLRRGADIELIRAWVEVAAKLGSPNLRIFAGKSTHDGYSREQVFEWMARDIKTCCEHGEKHGVIIALQNHNEFLKTAADVDEIFERVGSSWLGLNLDIGSYRVEDPYAEIERNVKHAVTWQIKENVWIDGEAVPTNLKRLAAIIHRSGYRGYLPLETLGPGDPYTKVPALVDKARSAGLFGSVKRYRP